MTEAVLHRDWCDREVCGFGCHADAHADLLSKLHASMVDRYSWINTWFTTDDTFIRHRLTMAAVRERKKGWSIIEVDNYGRDYQTEYFVEGDFPDEATARTRRDDILREAVDSRGHLKYPPDGDRYLTVRRGNVKLYVFEGY